MTTTGRDEGNEGPTGGATRDVGDRSDDIDAPAEPEQGERLAGNPWLADERRRRVFDLLARGETLTAIAARLDVSRQTISADLVAIRAQNRERALQGDVWSLVGDHDRALAAIEARALAQFEDLADERQGIVADEGDGGQGAPASRLLKSRGLERSKFLELSLKARAARVTLQLKTGMIPQVPDKLELGLFKIDGQDIRKMSAPQAREARDRLLERIAARQAAQVPDARLVEIVSGATLDPAANTRNDAGRAPAPRRPLAGGSHSET